MDNYNDDFEGAIKDVTIEREIDEFKITQLKVEHFYWSSGDIDAGMPVSTSIELTCEYNFQSEKLEWKKTITHNYLSLENSYEVSSNKYTSILEDSDQIINSIEKYDLRKLKNNYFSESNPERFTHWELTYNEYFKIVGTYDQEINEFVQISELLNFKKIINDETNKIRNIILQSKASGV